jgi:hypothetical protein
VGQRSLRARGMWRQGAAVASAGCAHRAHCEWG